jgi:hypothetical protein
MADRGSELPTYELRLCARQPVAGEIRFVRSLVPSPIEPFSSLLETFERVIWDGRRWEPCP